MSSTRSLRQAEKRDLVDYAQAEHGLSLRAACQVADTSRSVYHCRPSTEKDIPVIDAIQAAVSDYPDEVRMDNGSELVSAALAD